MGKKYIIEERLANAILNYLINRPYVEVANIVQGLQSMQIVEDIQKPKPDVVQALKNMRETPEKKNEKEESGGTINIGPAKFIKK